MRSLLLYASAAVLGVALVGASCQRPQPPPPPPAPAPTPTGLTATEVTVELVEAGCLAPGTADAVVAEVLDVDAHDQALRQSIVCLFEGGTIASCNAPCERAGFVRRP